jgi:ATP/maltotriose-dependent transcriptional regulator MalT
MIAGWHELSAGRLPNAEERLAEAAASIGDSNGADTVHERFLRATAFHLLAIARLRLGAFATGLSATHEVVNEMPHDRDGYNTRVVARVGYGGRVDAAAIADLERSLELGHRNNSRARQLVHALLEIADDETRARWSRGSRGCAPGRRTA